MKTLSVTLFLSTLWLATAVAAAPRSLDALVYDSEAAAGKSWNPMKGSLPARAGVTEGRPTLEFRCNFAGTQIERASWDHPVELDLSGARGIRFEVLCTDMSPVSYFSVYFQSGAGWYHASWFPERDNAWHTVTIERQEMGPEGNPGGWDGLKTIRISAWKGTDKDTTFFIRGLRPAGMLGVDADVAVLRGDAGSRRGPDESRSIQQSAERLANQLRAAGVECALLSDTAVSADELKKAKLVVLLHNPHMEQPALAAMTDYIRAGGKVLGFYSIPEALHPPLNLGPSALMKASAPGMFSGIRFSPKALPGAPARLDQKSPMIHSMAAQPGKTRVLAEWIDADGKPTGQTAVLASTNCVYMTHVLLSEDSAPRQQMLLAMAGSLAPELWRSSISNRMAEMSRLGNFAEFGPLTNHILRQAEGKGPAADALASAASHRAKAATLLKAAQYPEALAESTRAASKLEEAFCRAHKPIKSEFRGFWCHSAFGVKGMTWDDAIGRLAQNGFTAIVPNMTWGGAAYYPSRVLPQATDYEGDQIKECLAACRKHGIEIHVWKVNHYLGTRAPRDFVEGMRSANRLQVSFSGQPHDWLCPSHPENQKLEIDSMVEVAKNYPVDGIHFDYIRYPGSEYCFCSGCKTRFEKAAGLPVPNWPAGIRANAELENKWNEWRRGNITAIVKAVSEQARAVRPKIKISAAVFRLWDKDRDTVAQDWKVWCDKGYLDSVRRKRRLPPCVKPAASTQPRPPRITWKPLTNCAPAPVRSGPWIWPEGSAFHT